MKQNGKNKIEQDCLSGVRRVAAADDGK